MKPMQVGIKQAQKDMEDLIAAALAGEEVILTRYGKPVARMRALTDDEKRQARAAALKEAV
ncbi:MAG TPA: hypothetical protein VGD66_13120 [Allosphingosinicella sp.]|jgi:antitoxin (DNA-binding transcriptional repressor) of toxin-antitoxin stability system